MSVTPKKHFSLDEIARRLEAIKMPVRDGQLSFDGENFTDLQTILVTSLNWDDDIAPHEREAIVFTAVFEAGRQGRITKDHLLSEIHRLVGARKKKNPQIYLVVSTLSLRHGKHLRNLSWNGVTFSFYASVPVHIDRKAIQIQLDSPSLGPAVPPFYTVVIAELSARSPDEAASQALTALHVLRGIWNYTINFGVFRLWTSGRWKRLNKICLGPVSTVHHVDGTLAADSWWFQPHFTPSDSANLANEWSKMKKSVTWLLKQSKRLEYDVVPFWTRYAIAFDQDDLESSFLRLWSLLELLTVTNGPGMRYDETISRTLFTCDDREFHKLVLEHLRDCRNVLVHRDESQSQVQHHVFQIKRYVEDLLRIHLAWAGKFKTVSDFGTFLSLPSEVDDLRARRDLLTRGLRFRKGPVGLSVRK